MSDDIPQDQVEAAARAICLRPDGPCGQCHGKAVRAIRVLTPLIAAVERERCAEIADEYANEPWKHDGSAFKRMVARIRSVKGAVT